MNGDGVYDFILFSADVGNIEAGVANGAIGTFLVNLATGDLFSEFAADAPTDGSTVLLPVYASDLGITPTNPRLTYTVNAFDETGAGESLTGTASFNAFAPAIGFMVVTEDNLSGASQANLIKVHH